MPAFTIEYPDKDDDDGYLKLTTPAGHDLDPELIGIVIESVTSYIKQKAIEVSVTKKYLLYNE